MLYLPSSSSSSAISVILSHSKTILRRPSLNLILSRSQPHRHQSVSTMSASLRSHAFAGNPSRLKTPKPNDPFSPTSAFQTLKTLLSTHSPELSSPDFKVLPFRKGRPLAGSNADTDSGALNWHLGWLSLRECKSFLENSEVNCNEDSFIYLGFMAEDDVVYWAIDLSEANGLVSVLGSKKFCFVELRTLMVATDWADARAMGELAIAGHVSLVFICDLCEFCLVSLLNFSGNSSLCRWNFIFILVIY